MADNYVAIRITASDTAKPDLTELQARLDELKGRVATARAEVDSAEADAVLADLDAKLDAASKKVASPRIDVAGASRAVAQVTAVEASLDQLDAKAAESATVQEEAAAREEAAAQAAAAAAEEAAAREAAAAAAAAAAQEEAAAKVAAAAAAEKAAQDKAAAAARRAQVLGALKMALVGVAVGAALAVAGASSFDAQTTRLVTSAGESAKNLDLVRQGMLGIAASTATSTSEMAAGMYTVESAGYHGAQALIVLKAAAQGAKDEGASLAVVSNAVTDALVDFHQPASAAANVTSQLIAAVSHGKTNFEEFSSSMSNVLPLAAAMHLKLSDVTGVLAEMTAHGMSALQASQDEANAMRSLIGPTAAMSKEYKLLGITSQEVQAKLGSVGLAGTMQWLSGVAQKGAHAVGQNYTQALHKLMGTAPGLVTALMTTGKNAGETTAAIKGIAGASADAKGNVDGFSTVSQTAAFKLAAAKESIVAAGISLGQVLLPSVVAVLTPLTHMLQVIAGNKAASIAFAVVVGGLLAGALGGKLASSLKDASEGIRSMGDGISWLLGKMAAQTAAQEAQTAATEAGAAAQAELDAAEDANPIGLIILAVVALIAAIVLLVTHWKEVAHWGAEAFHAVVHAVSVAIDWVKQHWPLLLAILTGPIGLATLWIVDHWRQVTHVFDEVISWVKSNWKVILAWLIAPIGMAVFEIRSHTHQIAQEFDRMRHDVAAILDGARHDVAAAFDAVRHDLAAFADWVPHEVRVAWDTARHETAAALDAARHYIASSFDWMRHTTASQLDAVVHFFEQLPGRLMSQIKALPGQMLNAGKNIILGLVHGIEAAAAAIPSVMSGLAHTVESYFTNPLQMFSPSRKFIAHGERNIGGALVIGLDRARSAIRGAMGRMADTVQAGAPGVAGGYGAHGAGGAQEIHLYLHGSNSTIMNALMGEVRVMGGDPRMFQRKVVLR